MAMLASSPFFFFPAAPVRPFTRSKITRPPAASHFRTHATSSSDSPSTARRVIGTTAPSITPDAFTSYDHEKEEDDEVTALLLDYQNLLAPPRPIPTSTPTLLRTVEGAVPADFPSGTYYLVGPGLNSDDRGTTVHPFDAHGYLRAFAVDGGSGEVTYSGRYVETEAWKEEYNNEKEGGEVRFTHRGVLSVLKGGNVTKVMKNVANTTVVKWGTRLLCLWEGGLPHVVEQGTLDTIGLFDVDDQMDDPDFPVRSRFDLAPADLFGHLLGRFMKLFAIGIFRGMSKRVLAHYKIDEGRKRMVLAATNTADMFLPRTTFTFYEYDTSFKLLNKRKFCIPEALMIHDWALTDTHYVIFGNRFKLHVPDALRAFSGSSPFLSAFHVDKSRPTSPMYVLPRFSDDAGHRDWRRPIEAPRQLWSVHVANAFEERDEAGNVEIQMQTTACSYDWYNPVKFPGYDWASGRLHPAYMNAGDEFEEKDLIHLFRVTVEMNEKKDSGHCSIEPLSTQWNRSGELPTINPRFSGTRNKYMYFCTSSGYRSSLPHFPFDSISKIDVEKGSVAIWCAEHRRYVGEAFFIPRGDEEDDGYLLLVEYAVAMQMRYLVVLDAKLIGKPEALVAKLEIPKHLFFPWGFHGFWAPTD
ncbi:hypothetical protein H6P81_005106 [Aristolochia fimbriata]|uniref:Carotenoid cleavage dioxygenase 7, chloroplastic n=1 Tax=Aristolochia fimbriata TaxID=158543 RepID=A0AAV7EX22_ARIFI|nr:hypothetical protein H6P81_005106 [Aristolochia fimbriata]